ncbi:hypothetical protein, partial [Pedobacter sp.]
MKNITLIYLGLVSLLFACKKSKDNPPDKESNKDGTVTEVYPGILFNDAQNFIPSFDGNNAIIKTNSLNNQYQYSTDGGATWQNLNSVKNVLSVNDKGFYVYDPQNGSRQFSKLGKPDAGFTYYITGGEFILGKDDYIYDVNVSYNANKITLINSNNGESTVVNTKADTLGKY